MEKPWRGSAPSRRAPIEGRVVVFPIKNERYSDVIAYLQSWDGRARELVVVADCKPLVKQALEGCRFPGGLRIWYVEQDHFRYRGLSGAYEQGVVFALTLPMAEWVITVDCGTWQPSQITAALDATVSERAWFGVRPLTGGRSRLKLFLTQFGGALIRRRTGVGIIDPTCGYRAYAAETLREIDFAANGVPNRLYHAKLAVQVQCVVALAYIGEFLCTHRPTPSKMRLRDAVTALWYVLRGGLGHV